MPSRVRPKLPRKLLHQLLPLQQGKRRRRRAACVRAGRCCASCHHARFAHRQRGFRRRPRPAAAEEPFLPARLAVHLLDARPRQLRHRLGRARLPVRVPVGRHRRRAHALARHDGALGHRALLHHVHHGARAGVRQVGARLRSPRRIRDGEGVAARARPADRSVLLRRVHLLRGAARRHAHANRPGREARALAQHGVRLHRDPVPRPLATALGRRTACTCCADGRARRCSRRRTPCTGGPYGHAGTSCAPSSTRGRRSGVGQQPASRETFCDGFANNM